MRLGIINDLHIAVNGEPSHNVDTKANTRHVLAALQEASIDRLYILGDICLRAPRMETYAWLKEELRLFDVPIYFVPGNHDDPDMMQSTFGSANTCSPYAEHRLGKHLLLLLDTSSSHVSADQLNWLQQRLEGVDEDHLHVFIHHPPMDMHVPYMDQRHSLKNKEELLEVLMACGKEVSVLAGHYHVEKSRIIDKVTTLITPSCYVQIDQDSKQFAVDHFNIGYRLLDLDDAGYSTTVSYLPGTLLEQVQ